MRLARMLEAAPRVSGVLFDTPNVIEPVRAMASQALCAAHLAQTLLVLREGVDWCWQRLPHDQRLRAAIQVVDCAPLLVSRHRSGGLRAWPTSASYASPCASR